MTIRVDVTVLNLVALSLLHVAELEEGANAWVDSESDYYTLEKSSAAVVDGNNVIQPASGAPIAGATSAKWVRSSMTPGGTAGTQVAWFINSTTGSDTNTGLTALTALATWTELRRRVIAANGFAANLGAVTVEVQTNLPASDPMDLTQIVVRPGSILQIHGTLPAVPIYSGSITNITAKNVATNQALQFTDTALPVSWAASGLVDKRCRVTTVGARFGTFFWPAKSLGAKAARVTTPTLPAGVNSPTYPTLIVGDTFVVESLVTIDTVMVGGVAMASSDDSLGGRIVISDLAFLSGGWPIFGLRTGGYIFFQGCDLAGQQSPYEMHTGCKIMFLLPAQGSLLWERGSYSPTGSIIQIIGSTVILENYLTQGQRFLVQDGGVIELSLDNAAFDSSGAGFEAQGKGAFVSSTAGTLYGSGNATFGIKVASQCSVVYITKPTVTGTTNDTSIGGVATAYAGVPAITAANGAGIVLNA